MQENNKEKNLEPLLTELEAGALRNQIDKCSISLISLKKVSIPYTDGDHFSDGVEVVFGVAAYMETDFTITQTVPLPESAFPIDQNLNAIVETAKVALKQRLRRLDAQLQTPGVAWLDTPE